MTWDLVKIVLGNATITAGMIAGIAAVWRVRKDKRNNIRIDERDANEQLTEMRAAAEQHLLEYDVPMRERMVQHEALINQQRLESGKEPVVFPPLPTPTPLFPRKRP